MITLSTIGGTCYEQISKNWINSPQLSILSDILRKFQLNPLNGSGVVAIMILSPIGTAVSCLEVVTMRLSR